jgi:hypothetical protein
MFCPKCATQNIEGGSFCRSCGANLSLIPHALTGSFPQTPPADDSRSSRRSKRHKDVEPSIEKGILNVFIGIGFIVAALAVMFKFPAGIFWGWSLFIPGFSHLGRGVASIVAARRSEEGRLSLPAGDPGAFLPNQHSKSSPPIQLGTGVPRTGELRAPVPSVTEGTTRHLGAEAPTRHFDPITGEEKSP